MAKRRVVVTGMGAVTPIGLSVDEFWQNVKAQKTGFSEITKFDTTNYKCKLAAEVKEFDAKNYMDAKEARRMELFSQYAVAAAKEAIEDSGLEIDQEDPYMAGCVHWKRRREAFRTNLSANISRLDRKRTGESGTVIRSHDDLQYGSRKCFHSFWIKRKKYQCRDRLCHGNEYDR